MTNPIEAIKERLANIPYAQTLGIETQFMGEEFTLVLPYRESNIGNPSLPALHGGGVGGFMEVCAIAQLILNNPNRELPRPIGINIDYLRRGRPVETYARAQIFKQGSRVANLRVRAWQDRFETPIATLNGHFLLGKDNT
ncbi:thioesterase [Algimonas arctica]|uniref:Thioesterase n=1 Tax=Algimonas arctica TaxID=1479486 RepID=A0A8J3CQY4_9PROT|nr:PaaI family thioesterase [Algimonas arctica]GHA88416.1 thioesterase [Algimonas arctica]